MESRITVEYKSIKGEIDGIELEDIEKFENINNVSSVGESLLEEAELEHANDSLLDKILLKKLTNNKVIKKIGAYVSGPTFFQPVVNKKEIKLFGQTGYDGYNSRSLSNQFRSENKDIENRYDFENKPSFNIKGSESGIANFVVVFDELNFEYAPTMTVKYNAETVKIMNNQTVFVYAFDEPVEKFQLIINSWNKPNTFAKISNISVSFMREYKSDRVINFTTVRENRANHESFELGLNSLYGNIKFFDKNNEFNAYNNAYFLQDGLNVFIEVKDNSLENYIPIGCYKTQGWNISADDMQISLNLTDVLEKLKDIKLDMINLNEFKDIKVLEIIEKLLRIGGFDEEITFIGTDITSLESTIPKNIFLEKNTVYDMLKHILQSVKMRLYIEAVKDEDIIKPVAVLYKVY